MRTMSSGALRRPSLSVHRALSSGATAWVVASACAVSAGCGGGGSAESGTAAASSQQAYAQAVIAPLLDDEGRVMPSDPSALPADPGSRTLSGRYATAAQAEQLEAALPDAVISIAVADTPDGAAAVESAALLAHGLRAAHDLDRDVPVFVRGTDLRRAASVANRLQAEGFRRVFLVNG